MLMGKKEVNKNYEIYQKFGGKQTAEQFQTNYDQLLLIKGKVPPAKLRESFDAYLRDQKAADVYMKVLEEVSTGVTYQNPTGRK